jgi:hypothetical protein
MKTFAITLVSILAIGICIYKWLNQPRPMCHESQQFEFVVYEYRCVNKVKGE